MLDNKEETVNTLQTEESSKMSSTPTSPTSPVSPVSGQPLSNQQPPENIYRATQPYKPRHDGEIELYTGDILTNTKPLGNGWTLGQNVSRDSLGIFPSSYIEPLNSAATSATLQQSTDKHAQNRGDNPYNNRQQAVNHSLSGECDLPSNNTPSSTSQLPNAAIEGVEHNSNNPSTRGNSSGTYTSNKENLHNNNNKQQQTQVKVVDGSKSRSDKNTGPATVEINNPHTGGGINEQCYEVLRPNLKQKQQLSSNNTSDTDKQYSEQQKEPARLATFKPSASLNVRPEQQQRNYNNWQNSMENDVNSNEINNPIRIEDKLRSGSSREDIPDGIFYSANRERPRQHNEENIYSNRNRKASPKRVRIKLDADVLNESVHNNASHDPENSNEIDELSVNPVILPNLISKPIKQHPLISPEYNNPEDVKHPAYLGNNGQYFNAATLPTPMKRGRFTPTLPQKPKLVVKPNHLSQSMDDDDTMQAGIDRGQVVNNNDNRPPQSPRVHSSPRIKASPRAPRRAGILQNTTPIMARVRASEPPSNLQLHNAAASVIPINTINIGASNETDVENVSCGAGDCNTIPTTRAVIVTAMPQNTSNLNQQYGGSFVQDRSTSPIYISEDSCGELSQCNNYGIERDNTTNECLSRSTPPLDTDYYDYRSLEGMDKTVRFREHNTCNLKYKPILKQQRHGEPNKTQHIYYREQKKKDPVLRLVFSVIAGLIFGILVFLWMYFYLDYSLKVAIPVAVSICILLIITFAISRLILCTAALLFPSLCTTRGRISFLLLITGFLVAGPIKNVYFNMHEVSRSMGCSAEQAYNQSMLLLEPFDEMMRQLDVTVDNLQEAAFDVSVGLDPLDEGLENVEMGLHKGKIQLYGTARTCKLMIQNALDKCATGITSAQEQCLGVITALGTVYMNARDVLDKINPERWAPKQQHLFKRQIIIGGTSQPEIDEPGDKPTEDELDICESLDTQKVCQSLNNTEMLCIPSSWAGEAIQNAINATQGAMHRLKKQLQFEVKSDPYYMARINSSREVFRIRQKVINEFDLYTKHFEQIVDILKKVFPVAVLILVYVAYLHVKHYMSKDTYDNIYITRNFMNLDQKRAQVAGNHLLPLKRYERNYLVDTTISDLSPPEDGLYRFGLCVFFIHLFLSIVCYMFDYILFWILFLIQKHGNPEIDVTGQAALENVLDGDGVIVELLDVFLIGFHRGNAYGFDRGVNQCLPFPHMPKLVYVVVIILMYIVLLLTILLKAYMLRLRNEITGFFYPERRKQRTVHLYNVILNQRSRMPKLLQTKSRLNHRERCLQEQISFCHKMAARCAPCRVFLYQSPRCLVCAAVEDHTFRDCETERCSGVFCAECWSDLGRVCPLCLQGMEYDDEDIDNYEELEDDLQPYLRSSKIYL